MENLFIYGTLRNPETQKKVLGRIAKTASDAVEGYERSEIESDGETYPLIVPNELARVEGELIQVTTDELMKIDDYEGVAYKRERVVLESGISAWVYVRS